MRPADHKAPGGINEDARIRIEQRRWDYRADHMCDNGFADLFLGHIGIMLRADDNGIHAHRLIALVFNAHLRFTIRPKER